MAAFILPILSGLAGLTGGLGKNQQTQNQNSNTTGSSHQTTSGSSQTNPVFGELQQRLMQLFTGGAEQMFRDSTDMGPYQNAGLQNIGAQGNQNRKMLDAILAQRGLSFSPAAATSLTQNALNTGNQQSQFLSQIPLLQRQMQQGGLDQLMRAFATIPTGSESSSSGETFGTSQSQTQGQTQSQAPGNPLAGFFGGLGAALPLAFPNLFGGQQKSPATPGPNINQTWLPSTSTWNNPAYTPGYSPVKF